MCRIEVPDGGQARALLDAPGTETEKGEWDRAILSVLLYHGLRREEPCTLNVRDIYPRRGVRHAPGVCLEPGRRAGMADIRVSARRQIPAQSKRGQDRPSPMRTHREAWRSRTEVGQKRPARPPL